MSANATVIKNPTISWNSVDYSSQCREIVFNFAVDQKEKTASGDTEHTFVPGLNVATLEGTFYMERGASKLEANMWAAIQAGTMANLVVKPSSAATSASNPQYTVQCFVGSFQFISGQVGNEEICKVVFVPSGNVSRTTA